MPKIERLRTTAFRLAPQHFGTVHIFRPGPRFGQAWDQLERQWRRTGDTSEARSLPYRGLATALRVLTGDFVALQRQVAKENAFVLSRRPITRAELEIAIGAWEVHALGMNDGPVSRFLDDLVCESVDVAEQFQRRPGTCPILSDGNRWVWDAAIWEVAHRMAATPLETDGGPRTLRLDSDAALLTWDRPVESEDGKGAAMHKIVPLLITVPGIEEPVVSFQSSLVRLAPSWRETGGARYAWADIAGDGPILRGRVRNKKVDGDWQTVWEDRAAEVLRGASLHPLPDTAAGPSLSGELRTGYPRPPKRYVLGRGVGTWFHECVAHHARKALGTSVAPVELETTRRTWPTKERVAPRSPLGFDKAEQEVELRLLVVYANSVTRRRVRDALAYVLAEDADARDAAALPDFAERLNALEDGQVLRAGPIEVRFVRPPEAQHWLLERSDTRGIVDWLDSWLSPVLKGGSVTAAIVETDEAAANGKDALADPKHVLRGALGERGIVTQFIVESSAPKAKKVQEHEPQKFNDYAAANAVGDLMRSAGFFLRPFPEFGLEPGTLVVGIYGTQATRNTTGRDHSSFLVNLVAVSIGAREAWGFGGRNGWLPLDRATARFVGAEHDLTKDEAAALVEAAVGQLPLVFGDRPVVLIFDALGCRRFWPCLADKSDGVAPPWMRRGGMAVVRVRTAAGEVPRPAGVGDWDDGLAPAKHTDFRPMAVAGAEGNLVPTFVLSGSGVMSQGMSARKSTRLATTGMGLGEDWHSLGATELLVLDAGRWDRAKLLEQVAMLCRIAPTWDRTLRWPSPLHLARAVVRDHPHRYFADGEAEAEEVEDGRQMRLDFGF
ncbi:MAG: DUF3962 domain-containing protein [Pseudomonadota bacterium]|nr:DUF3962 domain-containing protein [Pseudomonadota bacterium]